MTIELDGNYPITDDAGKQLLLVDDDQPFRHRLQLDHVDKA